jgi:hypothetical protein
MYGSASLATGSDPSHTYPVDGYFFNQNFDDINITSDVALVHLATAPASATYAALNSDDATPATGSDVDVAGWGATNYDPSDPDYQTTNPGYPHDLREATIQTMSNAACEGYYPSYTIVDTELCAADFTNDRDACFGDSGGPLVYGSTLVGIVSWGDGCAVDGAPGVYTRVSSFKPWVDDHMAKSLVADRQWIDFYPAYVGTSYSQGVTLTNFGSQPVALGTPAIDPGFSISDTTCGSSLAGGASCTVTVTYAPTAPAPVDGDFGYLTVPSSDNPDGDIVVEVDGWAENAPANTNNTPPVTTPISDPIATVSTKQSGKGKLRKGKLRAKFTVVFKPASNIFSQSACDVPVSLKVKAPKARAVRASTIAKRDTLGCVATFTLKLPKSAKKHKLTTTVVIGASTTHGEKSVIGSLKLR